MEHSVREVGSRDFCLTCINNQGGYFLKVAEVKPTCTTHVPRSTMGPLLERTLQILLKLSLVRMVATSGCSSSSPLGMESGTILDNQLTAFSSHPQFGPENARLNRTSEWRANANNQSQWLQVDLRKRNVLTGIQTQGQRRGRDRFVMSFEVSYSDDGIDWTVFTGNSDQQQLFEGNNNTDSIRENAFNPPITARYIRVHPRSWHICGTKRCIAMRIELLGCELTTTTEPTSTITRTTQSTSTSQVSTSTNGRSSPAVQTLTSEPPPHTTQASVSTTIVLNTTKGDDGELDMLQGSGFPTEIVIAVSVAGVVVILAIAAVVVLVIRRRGINGSQKEPTNDTEGEGTVENIIYDSATFSANETGGGVSFGQSDGFVDNDIYAGVGESPTVQNQTSQKNDQHPLYANVNNSQDEGFVDNDLYVSLETQNRDY